MKKNIPEIEHKFSEYLKTKGLRVTPQRMKILNAFLHTEDHVSMEELFLLVRRSDSTVGQVTVYRTLKLLCDARLAMEIHFTDGVTRYEIMTAGSHHDHIMCVSCGKIIEIYDQRIEKIQKQIAQKNNFTLLGHYHVMYGLCEDCRKEKSEMKGDSFGEPGIPLGK